MTSWTSDKLATVSLKWASLIVAIVALAQVWLIALWRRFFRKGSIDIHETGLIEIGYSPYGPTLSLQGTLRAVHNDQFVRQMHLVVTRNRDGAQHWFDWETFRSGTSPGQMSFETPAGFLIATNQPHRYNVFFSDLDTRGDVQQALAETREAWQATVVENSPADDDERAALYTEFREEPVHFDTHARLTQLSYWNAGRYLLSLYVETSRPDKTFPKHWSFVLTGDNAESLRLNAVPTLLQTCGFGEGLTFNFANARYEEAQEGD